MPNKWQRTAGSTKLPDHEKIDLSLFLLRGEGYASWYYKVQKFFGKRHLLHFPTIALDGNKQGGLKLQDSSVIEEIARRSGMQMQRVSEMIQIDLAAVQPYSNLLKVDAELKSASPALRETVERFCICCFEQALSSKVLPAFNPQHSAYFATHCLVHQSPLASVKLLDDYDMSQNMSQFDFWHASICDIRLGLNEKRRILDALTIQYPSKHLIDLNRLFSSETIAGEPTVHNTEQAEVLRQKVFGVYYLLWVRRGRFTLGEELLSKMGVFNSHVRFPSFNVLSLKNLSISDATTRSICTEILGMFLLDLGETMPIYLRKVHRNTKAAIIKRSSEALGALENNPLVILAWECFNLERDYCLSEVEQLFPLFYKEWFGVVSKLQRILDQKQ